MQPSSFSRLPLWKRSFDIAGSLALILMLLPVFALIALAVRLESRGPIFYTSKRVGRGYRIFDFYKFRSMRAGADAKLKELMAQSQYGAPTNEETPQAAAPAFFAEGKKAEAFLVGDAGPVSEPEFWKQKKQEEQHAFFKMKDDPRITRVGQFIRSTSLDELPQLFNVLKGDMSLVGNRPLPLYEAEKLTADDTILRFCAPAGITGLWQVKARGKADMSEEQRKRLDVEYAQQYNFLLDMEILIKTPLAAIQEVNA
ncbi:MAG: UDP-glucose:undecaprenyl-phosphate glucose-1-phosphate transferase [Haliscomenobacter sp.]|jgi:lipopolysaccharide/colanic/teichoic acid biosynthesis glycosyltransferase|nr:UDP-glucose:undecaprenyl-phosphate glucose-1-phosphate transferase [Haliscomenobacter sp.]